MSAIDYPALFEKKLAKNRSVRAAVDKTIDDFGEWFGDSKLPFFTDYTDHGPRHLAKVLTIADQLIADRSHDAITAEDVAVLILSVVLHDSAMHLSEAGFRSLVKGPMSDNQLDAFNERSWPELWSEFLATATRWDDQRLIELFGADENGAPIAYVHDPFNHYNNLRRSDRDLIGEFLRQHHPRLAHEFGVLGVPGAQGEAVIRPAFDDEVCDLAGLVARSHGLPLRRCLDYLETKYDMREYDNIHPVYLMCLLRVADYLDLGGDRAPTIALRYKDVRSPVSRREFTVNQAFRKISWGNPDPESIKIPAWPRDVQAFLQVKDWLSGIQAELDQCWAVLGEVYGASHSGNYELSIRRVRSNVDNIAAFSKRVLYIPRYVEFETARAQLLKLLIEPLYGKNPEIAVRELMQNAVDAVRELSEFHKNHPESTGVQMLEQAGDVEIWFDPPDRNGRRVLRVSDRGIGMTADIICNYFLRAGASFRESDAWKREFTMRDSAGAQHSKVVRSGRFGVGVLAAFLLGNEISVATRHVTESRGIRFKTKLDAGPIQLNYDDSLPVGTTVEIEMYADIFDKFTAGIKYGGPDWDWYCLENPRVIRRTGPTGIILKQAVKIPHAIEKPVLGWNEVPNHRYLSVRLDSNFTQPSMLVCNGIKIKPMANRGHEERHFFKLKNPLTSVMDPDAIFPLTLRRDDVPTKELDFQKAASETQAKAVLAKLLSSTVDELSASDWDRYWNAPMFVPIVFGHQGFSLLAGTTMQQARIDSVLFGSEDQRERLRGVRHYTYVVINRHGDSKVGNYYFLQWIKNKTVALRLYVPSPMNVDDAKIFPESLSPFFGIQALTESFAPESLEVGVDVWVDNPFEVNNPFKVDVARVGKLPSQWKREKAGPPWWVYSTRDCPPALMASTDLVISPEPDAPTGRFGELFLVNPLQWDRPELKDDPESVLARYWLEIIRQPFIPYDMEQRRFQLPHALDALREYLP